MFYPSYGEESDSDEVPELESSTDDENNDINLNSNESEVHILPETMYEFLTSFVDVDQSRYRSVSSAIIVDDFEEHMLSRAIVESQNTQQPTSKQVMSMEDFKSFDTYVYSKNAHGNPQECPISVTEFSEGDTIVILPCKHEFLKDNIQRWVTKESASCPVCRYSLPSHEIINFTD